MAENHVVEEANKFESRRVCRGWLFQVNKVIDCVDLPRPTRTGLADMPSKLLSRFPVITTKNFREGASAAERVLKQSKRSENQSVGRSRYKLSLFSVQVGETSLSHIICDGCVEACFGEEREYCYLYCTLLGNLSFQISKNTYVSNTSTALLIGAFSEMEFRSAPGSYLLLKAPLNWSPSPEIPVSFGETDSWRLRTEMVRFARSLNRSRTLPTLQALAFRDRIRSLPSRVVKEEMLLKSAMRDVLSQSNDNFEASKLAAIDRWISAHCSAPITVTQVCEQLQLTRRSTDRFFERHGVTVKGCIRHHRLEMARRLLMHPSSDTTVESAARQAGFRHLGRFASDFNEQFGVLPAQLLRDTKADLSTMGIQASDR